MTQSLPLRCPGGGCSCGRMELTAPGSTRVVVFCCCSSCSVNRPGVSNGRQTGGVIGWQRSPPDHWLWARAGSRHPWTEPRPDPPELWSPGRSRTLLATNTSPTARARNETPKGAPECKLGTRRGPFCSLRFPLTPFNATSTYPSHQLPLGLADTLGVTGPRWAAADGYCCCTTANYCH